MPRIDLRYLIKPNTTPEQELLLEHFYNQFDNGSAANRRIANVEPLFYQGATGATEFLVYSADKMYICYSLLLSTNNAGDASATVRKVDLYNETNAVSLTLHNQGISYNTTVPQQQYLGNQPSITNCIFSRFVTIGYLHMKFIGYRITLI